MNSQYFYSASRIKALETTLLTDGQLERLLGAKNVEEGYKVLHDTFLGEYISDAKKTKLSRALRKSITLTKHMLERIAPEPILMDYLWIRYDFYNLKTILKGKRAALTNEEILEKCYFASKYTPERILACVEQEDFSSVISNVGAAFKEAQEAREVWQIDIAMNVWYFRTIAEWSQDEKNIFIQEYVTLLIDMFNLRTRLRTVSFREGTPLPEVFISGGNVAEEHMKTREQIMGAFSRFGGERYWKDALEEYEKHESFVMIERAVDDYFLKFLREQAIDVFSPVTLFAFFWARRNNAQLIQTVMTAKEAGVSEGEIRYVLRRLYT